VLEDLTTQIRFTLELSGIECTKLELVAKDKKGNLRSLMHFLDNKED
jgi:RecB family endonuclease NucS